MGVVFQGGPDWQDSILTDDLILLPAFNDQKLYFAVPRQVRLARRPDGSPQFFLEFVSDRNDATVEDSLYAVIDLGLERIGDVSTAYDLVAKDGAAAALMPASFTTGTYCHLECGDTHLTVPFVWENAQRATLHSRIPVASARILYGALASGSVTMARAAVECAMGAVLPRVEAAVVFDAADLLASVTTLSPAGQTVAFDQMVRFLDHPPGGLLRFEGEDRGACGRSLGLALAGRVRHFFGQPASCPKISDGPHVALKLRPDSASGTLRWDLRTPLFTETPIFLAFDPFTPIISAGDRQRVTGFTSVPALPNDLRTRRITVASGLPPGLRNCESIDITLRVDKTHSASGATAVNAVNLYPGDGPSTTATIDLVFKSIAGAKPFSSQLIVVSDGDMTAMPWLDADSEYLFVEASQLPGTCVTTRATPELLEQAAISVALDVGPKRADVLSATLTASEPAASFLLAKLDETARLAITAHDPRKPDAALKLDLPCRSVTADLSSFREYGPQTTSVAVRFKDSQHTVKLEFLPEFAGAKPIVLEFSDARPQMRFNYFATDIFQNRYRFRRHSPTDHEAPWSDYRAPREDLVIDLSQLPEAAISDGSRLSGGRI